MIMINGSKGSDIKTAQKRCVCVLGLIAWAAACGSVQIKAAVCGLQ